MNMHEYEFARKCPNQMGCIHSLRSLRDLHLALPLQAARYAANAAANAKQQEAQAAQQEQQAADSAKLTAEQNSLNSFVV